MAVETSEQVALETLQDKATRLRIDSVLSTTEAGSGHPTSCASAAEIVAVLFYSVMRYDPLRGERMGGGDARHAASLGRCAGGLQSIKKITS